MLSRNDASSFSCSLGTWLRRLSHILSVADNQHASARASQGRHTGACPNVAWCVRQVACVKVMFVQVCLSYCLALPPLPLFMCGTEPLLWHVAINDTRLLGLRQYHASECLICLQCPRARRSIGLCAQLHASFWRILIFAFVLACVSVFIKCSTTGLVFRGCLGLKKFTHRRTSQHCALFFQQCSWCHGTSASMRSTSLRHPGVIAIAFSLGVCYAGVAQEGSTIGRIP